ELRALEVEVVEQPLPQIAAIAARVTTAAVARAVDLERDERARTHRDDRRGTLFRQVRLVPVHLAHVEPLRSAPYERHHLRRVGAVLTADVDRRDDLSVHA